MKFSEMNWPELRKASRTVVAILPLGATEQHGPHLAVSADTAIVTAIAEEAERRLPRKVVLAPTLPFGSSHHHRAFGGTISLSAPLYAEAVADLVESLVGDGFRRIVLLNGHGGNIVPVSLALARLGNEARRGAHPNVALATYWEMAGGAFKGEPPMRTPALSHACEYETSLMLHLFPLRVRMERARRARRPPSNGYVAWEEDEPYRGVGMPEPTHLISGNGSSGEPAIATSAKGRHLFGRAVEATVKFLSEFGGWPLMKDLRRR